jgi:hypothetical protein
LNAVCCGKSYANSCIIAVTIPKNSQLILRRDFFLLLCIESINEYPQGHLYQLQFPGGRKEESLVIYQEHKSTLFGCKGVLSLLQQSRYNYIQRV